MSDQVRGAGRSMREKQTPGSGKGSSQQRGLGETESCWAGRGDGRTAALRQPEMGWPW